MEEVHVYVRVKETGRFATHFLVDKAEWDKWELFAQLHNMTMDEMLERSIREYADNKKEAMPIEEDS